jgi:hypothetical protein
MAFSNFKGKTFKQVSSSAAFTKKEAYKKIPTVARHGVSSSKGGGLIDYVRVKTALLSNPDAYHIEQDNTTNEVMIAMSASEFRYQFNSYFSRHFSGTSLTDISASFFSQFGAAADAAELQGQKFMMLVGGEGTPATGSYSLSHGIVNHNVSPALKTKKITFINSTPTASYLYTEWGGLSDITYIQDDVAPEFSFFVNVTQSFVPTATSSLPQTIVGSNISDSSKNIQPLHTGSAAGGPSYDWDGLITSSYTLSSSNSYGPKEAFNGLTAASEGYRPINVSSSNLLLSYNFGDKKLLNEYVGNIGPNYSLNSFTNDYPLINQIKLYWGDENYYHKQVQISGSMDGSTWIGIAQESGETDNSDARTFTFTNTRGYKYYGVYFKSGSYKNGAEMRITGIEYEYFPRLGSNQSQIFHLTSSLTSSTVVGIISGSPQTPALTLEYIKQNQNGTTVDNSEGVYLEGNIKGKIFGDGLFGEGEASSSAYDTSGNALFTPSRNYIIYPSESAVRSGSFRFSTSSAANAIASGTTSTLYYLKGTTGPSGSYSGAFGVSSGSHIWSNSTLETPASSGYYHIPGTSEVLFAFKQGVTADVTPDDHRHTQQFVPRFTSKSVH